MPCYDARPDNYRTATKMRLDAATRAACTAMKWLEKHSLLPIDDYTQTWWEEHKKMDKKREDRSVYVG